MESCTAFIVTLFIIVHINVLLYFFERYALFKKIIVQLLLFISLVYSYLGIFYFLEKNTELSITFFLCSLFIFLTYLTSFHALRGMK